MLPYVLGEAESGQAGVAAAWTQERQLLFAAPLAAGLVRRKEGKKYVPERKARVCSEEGTCWVLCLASICFLGFEARPGFLSTIQSLSWISWGLGSSPIRYSFQIFPRQSPPRFNGRSLGFYCACLIVLLQHFSFYCARAYPTAPSWLLLRMYEVKGIALPCFPVHPADRCPLLPGVTETCHSCPLGPGEPVLSQLIWLKQMSGSVCSLPFLLISN